MSQQIMTDLARITDELFRNVSEEKPISSDPILGSIGKNTNRREADVPPSLLVELYGPKAVPAIHIGDRWGYAYAQGTLSTGLMKFKKATVAVKVEEDDIAPILENKQDSAVFAIVDQELRDQNELLRLELQRLAIGDFTPATEYTSDKYLIGLFGLSNTGTITNPSDITVDADGSTKTDLTALIWSGSQQTSRNIETLLAALIPRWGLYKDTVSGRMLPAGDFTLYVPMYFYRVLQSVKDIKDANAYTTSQLFYLEELRAAGVTVIGCEQLPFISDYDPDGDAADCVMVSQPKKNFILHLPKPKKGVGWSEWEELFDGQHRAFVKSKKVMFAFEVVPYLINGTYYSPKIKLQTTPYDNTA